MKIKIAINPFVGRYLVANQDFEIGDVLLLERAYGIAPIPNHLSSDILRKKSAEEEEEGEGEGDPSCFHCLRAFEGEAQSSIPCPTCAFSFCGQPCHDSYAAFHQVECPFVPHLLRFAQEQNCQMDELRYLILALRIVVQAHDPSLIKPLQHPASSENSPILRSNIAMIQSLQPNFETHRLYEPDLVNNARKLASVLTEVLPADLRGAFSRSSLVELFLSFNVNAYSIGEFGVGMYFFAALTSHSCAQNASIVDHELLPGVKMLRALSPIKAGQEICISYIATDLVMPTFLRRQKLLSAQLFWCGCPRCLDPLEQGRMLRCVQCPECAQIAVNPLPTAIKAPPTKAAPQGEGEEGEEGEGEEDQGDEDQNDEDYDEDDHDHPMPSSSSSSSSNFETGSSTSSSSSSSSTSTSTSSTTTTTTLDQPDAAEVWECKQCGKTFSGDTSPRASEKKMEELFLAAKQLLMEEDGTLSPSSVDDAQAEKAIRLLEFCLQNKMLHEFHYLKDMVRELLNAVLMEKQLFTKALALAPALIATASRLYPAFHFEKGQLFETLAQLTLDAESASEPPASFLELRREYLQNALEQYQIYFGPKSTPALRIVQRLESEKLQ